MALEKSELPKLLAFQKLVPQNLLSQPQSWCLVKVAEFGELCDTRPAASLGARPGLAPSFLPPLPPVR